MYTTITLHITYKSLHHTVTLYTTESHHQATLSRCTPQRQFTTPHCHTTHCTDKAPHHTITLHTTETHHHPTLLYCTSHRQVTTPHCHPAHHTCKSSRQTVTLHTHTNKSPHRTFIQAWFPFLYVKRGPAKGNKKSIEIIQAHGGAGS